MSSSLKAAAVCALALFLAACGGGGKAGATSSVPPSPGLYSGALGGGRNIKVVLTGDRVIWGAAFKLADPDTPADATVFRTSYSFDGDQIRVQADQPQGLPALPAGTSLRIVASYTAEQIQGDLIITKNGVAETLPITLLREALVEGAPRPKASSVSPLQASIPAPGGGPDLTTTLTFEPDGNGRIDGGSASPRAAGTNPSVLRGNMNLRNDCNAFDFLFQVGNPTGNGNSILEATVFQSIVIPHGANGYIGFGLATMDDQALRVVFLRKFA